MKVDEVYKLSREKLDKYLLQHNLRHTLERYQVLLRACELPSPFTVDQLVEATREDHISQATVYNVLNLLKDARIAHLLGKQYRQNKDLYEITSTTNNHLQIICTQCGREAEFKDVAVMNLLYAKRFNNFDLQHFSLYVYGECKVCRKKKKQE